MKVIEKKIVFEDYNYVEGILELKVQGRKFAESKFKEEFSIDSINSAIFIITKKYLFPDVPTGIKNNRLFSLKLPIKIPTTVNALNNHLKYEVSYDEIIVDDTYVDDNGHLKVNRYNTVKDGTSVFSTFKVKAYGLRKSKRTEIIEIEQFQLFSNITGQGEISISPDKAFFSAGEEVTIKAKPKRGFNFIEWRGDFKDEERQEIKFKVDSDKYFDIVFTDIKVEPKEGTSLGRTSAYSPKGRARRRGVYANIGDSFSDLLYWVWSIFIGIVILFIVINILISLGWAGLILIGIFVGLWLIPYIFSVLFEIRVLRWIFTTFLFLFLLSTIFRFVSSIGKLNFTIDNDPEHVETVEVEKDNNTTDYKHLIQWEDYDYNEYSAYIKINSDYVEYETLIRNSIPNVRSINGYNNLLYRLHQESTESLYYVHKSLDSIRDSKKLNKNKFAEVIVSMVQSIPYYVILADTCSPFDYMDSEIRDLIMSNPCVGYVKHGIKSPGEFIKDLKGDCDSRTLLLYSILKNYGYDVIILGSEYYKHSLLGINLPYSNTKDIYKTNGKNYLMWETTSKGFVPGNIPQELNITKYWKINLN